MTLRVLLIERYVCAIPMSNEGKRARQGHYQEKMSEKAEEDEEKQGWYSPKPLGESPSGPLARQTFQQASPWTRPTW
uniref:Uncharacterized protein n=1 Tax=Solanum tuberosum TaxID=4113 RepID=M1DJK8_SOLTU